MLGSVHARCGRTDYRELGLGSQTSEPQSRELPGTAHIDTCMNLDFANERSGLVTEDASVESSDKVVMFLTDAPG